FARVAELFDEQQFIFDISKRALGAKRSLSRLSQDRIADVGSYVSETLGQIKTVQAYNHQPQDERRFAVTVEQAFDTARKRIVQRAWLITLVIVLVLGAVGVMLWVGGMDVIA
ncbi:ABC transporter transmembrane domain-containing protein, partial [Pseudomonas sp. SIMBA_077]